MRLQELRPTAGMARRLRIGASAAMVLATAVSAQAAAPESPLAGDGSTPLNVPRVDLAWAVRGGATCAACSTRSALARHAAQTIHALDRLGAPLLRIAPPVRESEPREAGEAHSTYRLRLEPGSCSRQPSAP
ncbi:MAG: hypothetical protein M5U26_15785 [Planctomycetota bacterium]|nr:hypothetical protein [Planctomycetota bacterium]